MKQWKKLICVLAAALMMGNITACGDKGMKEPVSLTEQEKADGYKARTEIGFKYKLPEVFLTYGDNISVFGEGDEQNAEEPIFNQYIIELISKELYEQYYQIVNDTSLSDEKKSERIENEILANTKKLLAFTVLRTDKTPKEASEIAKVTKFAHNDELRRTDKYVQFFSYSDTDSSDLGEESKKMYEELMGSLEELKKSISVGEPMSMAEGIGAIKNFKFKSVDLDGNPVDESVFKNAKLTMVNVWATWCGPCTSELPHIAKVAEEYKDKGFQVLGILSDAQMKENEEENKNAADEVADLAKQILRDANATYLNVKTSADIEGSIMKFVVGLPTSFFMDENGNVVGQPFVGAKTEEEFKQIIENMLKTIEEKK